MGERLMSSLEGVPLDEALAHTADGVFVVGTDGRILLWNRAAERILGYTAREVSGRPCCDLFVGSDERRNRLCYRGCHVMTLVQMGEPVQNFDMTTGTKAGRPVWLNISILPITADRRGGVVTVHMFRDVTAARELLAMVRERLATPPPTGEASQVTEVLTRRELEVLRLTATGLNTKAAAERLHVSPATIRNHIQNIFGKLGVHSRLAAVAYATRHRLL
jgi:PAS domain S-box-containing protein